MNKPDPLMTAEIAYWNLERAIKCSNRGVPKKAELHLEDAVGLVERAREEFTGENVDHEYIGKLCEYDEYDMAQMYARYKRERVALLEAADE